MNNPYWTGTTEAHLDASHITASWGRGADFPQRIRFANEVFHFWYDARGNIKKCADGAERMAMTRALESDGHTGWGRGISDLYEAFEHLHENRGYWKTNTKEEVYFGGPTKLFRKGGCLTMPESLVNFADAVDDDFEKVRRAMEAFNRQTQVIDRQLDTSRTDWNRIGSALKAIKYSGESAKHLLWAAPRAEGYASATTSFAGALGNIHAGLTTYENARRSQFPDGPAAAIGALRTAVGFVPVLGSYYGAMVDLIPSLNRWFTHLVEDRVRHIDRLTSGRI